MIIELLLIHTRFHYQVNQVNYFFQPIVVFIVVMDTIAEKDDKQSAVTKTNKITKGLLLIIGITVLIFAIRNVVNDYQNLGDINTLKSFLLPPLLTILFLPFLYSGVLYSNYEQLFNRLDLGHEKSSELKKLAKKKIIRHCLFSIKRHI